MARLPDKTVYCPNLKCTLRYTLQPVANRNCSACRTKLYTEKPYTSYLRDYIIFMPTVGFIFFFVISLIFGALLQEAFIIGLFAGGFGFVGAFITAARMKFYDETGKDPGHGMERFKDM